MAASEATTASKTASEVKYYLRFEIRDPRYLLIHVHIAYMAWAHLALSDATTALEVKFDPRFEINDPNYICYHGYFLSTYAFSS